MSSGDPMEDEQGLYFLAPKVGDDLRGFPIDDTGAMILTNSQKPLWIPVSQERFLRHALCKAQELLDAQIADFQTSTPWLPTDATGEAENSRRARRHDASDLIGDSGPQRSSGLSRRHKPSTGKK